jgi:hypothetical protein
LLSKPLLKRLKQQ